MKTIYRITFTILFCLMFHNVIFSQMNFPLQVGNKFVYYFNWSEWWWGGGSSGNYRISYRVLKDSTFNNKKYYLMNAYPHYSGTNTWVRFDSTTKSIYAYDSANTCPYYFKEKLIDSLAMMSGTANSCSNKTFSGSRIDTLYGVIGTSKTFNYIIVPTLKKLQYNSYFGIIKINDDMSMGSYGHQYAGNMIGCFINGINYGDTIVTGIREINSFSPNSYKLSQNYPNPFNPSTVIRFNISGFPVGTSGNDKVVLKVYDVMGREVQTLVNERMNAGTYEVKFDGSMLTSGVYFYRLITDSFSDTKKMLLIK